jgi:hypothetical protein
VVAFLCSSVTCMGVHIYLPAMDRDRVFAFASSFAAPCTAPGAPSRPARGRTISRRISGGERAFYPVDNIPNESFDAFLECQGAAGFPQEAYSAFGPGAPLERRGSRSGSRVESKKGRSIDDGEPSLRKNPIDNRLSQIVVLLQDIPRQPGNR